MSHDPDSQKDAIIAHEKRENESYLAWQQSQPREFRMQRIGGFASRFESIMFAPDYTPEERRAKLLAWAWENRAAIERALRLYDAEQAA